MLHVIPSLVRKPFMLIHKGKNYKHACQLVITFSPNDFPWDEFMISSALCYVFLYGIIPLLRER